MACSSLRLDHIREVRDVGTYGFGDAVNNRISSALVSEGHKEVAYLRSTFGERWKVRSRRTLASRSTFAGR